ncbi:hypothetical protein H6P81_001279 [Aristolochia fimbriata]|uniref:Peptidase A1 domain-containing protein n=1 Tax=Aristolochia fimbriata TaxID=158543 RepID=A0AAV7F7P1_ARIFI|nr:hypothetical protein H6P81_001279 [Aristolochia fimbriata]
MTLSLLHRILVFSIFLTIRTIVVEPVLINDPDGFSVELIHYDSHLSSFYNASESISDRVMKAFRRSQSRLRHFQRHMRSSSLAKRSSASSAGLIQSMVSPVEGDYIMQLSVGSPPVKRPVIADTGSDLTWIQCRPCSGGCYKQAAPLFEPRNSSTYRTLSCKSKSCRTLSVGLISSNTSCGKRGDDACEYAFWYADESYTRGNLATDTFTFGSSEKGRVSVVTGIAFGCGTDNDGTFNRRETGLARLGRGSLSLVSQMGPSIGWKFSYCLAPHELSASASVLSFGGKAAAVSGNGVVTLPLVTEEVDGTLYYFTLEEIAIGSRRIFVVPKGSRAGVANVFSDSGTRFTYLERRIVKQMVKALSSAIPVDPVEDPNQMFHLCYGAGSESLFPKVTFRFTGGDLEMGTRNVFVKVSEKVTCLAVLPTDDGMISILGNVAQQNFRIGFDLLHNTVSFASADCSNL